MNQIKQQLDQLQKKYLTSRQLITRILDWNHVECEINKESSRIESRPENGISRAFAFNQENTILVAACGQDIIVYQFQNEGIGQQLQRLTDHTKAISSLYFMQKSNSFVSGSYDSLIIIWQFNTNKNKWFAKQKLQEHTNWVYCFVINSFEDLLITGSSDKTTKFWKKIKKSWSCQQTINMKDDVSALSLNETDDKLISCGDNQIISVMEKENADQWRIVQTINVSWQGFRLCFTEGDQFVFQPRYHDYIEIFSYDKGKKQFQILQKVKINKQDDGYLLFPCQYISQLKMISVKHGNYLNIFKINQGDYQFIKSIDFQSNQLFGRFTDDGQNLVTCDGKSREIQVRKLRYQK